MLLFKEQLWNAKYSSPSDSSQSCGYSYQNECVAGTDCLNSTQGRWGKVSLSRKKRMSLLITRANRLSKIITKPTMKMKIKAEKVGMENYIRG